MTDSIPQLRSDADREAKTPFPGGREVPVYLGIWCFAFLLRIIYLLQIKHAVVFPLLMSDARSYDSWAQQIARGNWLGHEVFYQAPLYPYFLGLVYAVLGRDFLVLRVVQAFLGATSCLFLALAGRLFFHRSIGILAGILLALYPSAIFYDCLIQKSVLDLFFLALLLFAWGVIAQNHRPGWLVAGGAILGLLTLSRENALIFAIVMVGWLLVRLPRKRSGLVDGLKSAGLFLAGLALVLLPVAIRNMAIGGEFHLTTAQFGPNFYIGNNKDATGLDAPLRPGRNNPEFEREDATQLAEATAGRKLTPSEVSSYWAQRAYWYIRNDPMGWLRLMVRKWSLLWSAIEVPDTVDQYTYADSSPLLGWLTRLFHFGVLCPLGLFGILVTWRDRNRIWVLYVMMVAYAASTALFFVTGRYRFPLVVWLALFAAAGLREAYERLVNRKFAAVAVAAGVALGTGLCIRRGPLTENDCRSIGQANIAIDLAKQPGRTKEAISHFRLALQLRPDLAWAHNGLGAALASQGKFDEAIAELVRAVQLRPDVAETRYNLATALASQGRFDEAVVQYAEALRLQPGLAGAQNDLGSLLVDRGHLEQAIIHLREAIRLQPDLAFAQYNLARALVVLGRSTEAVAHYAEAVRLLPDNATALDALARLLATCKDDQVRNPAEAVALATRACQVTAYTDPVKLDTLAAAYAEAGRFPEAIQTAQKAADLVAAAGDQDVARAIHDRLELYKAGRPYRE